MREIEFRGKNIETGEWRYGSLIQCCSGKTYIFESGDSANESEKVGMEGCLAIFTFEVIPETVGQFIGLKYATMIFEGDIVRFWNTEGQEYIKVILWDDKYLCYNIGNMSYQTIFDSPFFQPSEVRLEVIGNIHDNPELLKERL